MYESRHEKGLSIRFGLDLTPRLDARQAQLDVARLQYYTQLSEARSVLTGEEDERLDAQCTSLKCMLKRSFPT